MATLIAHTNVYGATPQTTTAINTTGANFIAIVLFFNANSGQTITSVTDSVGGNSNTYTPLTYYNHVWGIRLYYTTPTYVGSGHTFSFALSGPGGGICVQAWSGMAASSVFQTGTDSGASAYSGNTNQPGSITPSGASLLISGVVWGNYQFTAPTINSSFAISDYVQYAGLSTYQGGGMASLIQSSGSAVNPTWNVNNNTIILSNIAAFKIAAPSTGVPNSLMMTGVGT